MSAEPFAQKAGPELTGRVCPYCRFPLKEGVAIEACGSCGAVHHAECWRDNCGCSVTGCVNGPSNTTATHAVATAAAPVTATAAYTPPPPPPPPPSKPPPAPANKSFPAGPIAVGAVVVALLGAGVALAISSSSQKHNTPTVTVKERTVEKTLSAASKTTAAHTSSTPPKTYTRARTPTVPAAPVGPSPSEREAHAVAAVDSYWGDIENHDFFGAYQIEEPSAGSSESEWVRAEEKEGIEHVSYSFEPGSLEGNEATVNVGSLETVARKTGCYTWTGYYRLTDYSGTWKITDDGLERHSC